MCVSSHNSCPNHYPEEPQPSCMKEQKGGEVREQEGHSLGKRKQGVRQTRRRAGGIWVLVISGPLIGAQRSWTLAKARAVCSWCVICVSANLDSLRSHPPPSPSLPSLSFFHSLFPSPSLLQPAGPTRERGSPNHGVNMGGSKKDWVRRGSRRRRRRRMRKRK